MSKLIFYKETMKHKLGDIVEGHIGKDGSIFIYDSSYLNSDIAEKDLKYATFLSHYFAIKYPAEYPVMELSKWREQQINKILDDNNCG